MTLVPSENVTFFNWCYKNKAKSNALFVSRSYWTRTSRNIKENVRKCNQIQNVTLSCIICGRKCGSASGLNSHMRSHERHGETNIHYQRQQQTEAPKITRTQSKLHGGDLTCHICGRHCGSPSGLGSHLRAHQRRGIPGEKKTEETSNSTTSR